MTPDVHTPCPACPIQVRALYAAAQVVLAILEQTATSIAQQEMFEGALEAALFNLAIAMEHLAPLIDAHLANQDHALSVELVDARAPSVVEPV